MKTIVSLFFYNVLAQLLEMPKQGLSKCQSSLLDPVVELVRPDRAHERVRAWECYNWTQQNNGVVLLAGIYCPRDTFHHDEQPHATLCILIIKGLRLTLLACNFSPSIFRVMFCAVHLLQAVRKLYCVHGYQILVSLIYTLAVNLMNYIFFSYIVLFYFFSIYPNLLFQEL